MLEIPQLNKVEEEYRDKIDVVAVSIDRNLTKLEEVLNIRGVRYRNVIDPEGNIADTFEVTATPFMFLIDKNGIVLKHSRHVEELKPFLEQLKALVKESLKSVTRDDAVMGTQFSIVILSDDTQKANATIDKALAEIKRIEDVMTDWRDSELTSL